MARAIEKGQLSARVQQLEKQLGQKFSFDTVLGTSSAIQSAVDLARKVAPTQASVLLTGETGTGKEVFAQSIHQASERRQKNFVAVNCAAFSKELLDSEMFGHVAGAFTGATKDKKGLFEEAHGGTIFLDELGEMPLDLQAKLLRVLESGEYNRVGDSKRMKSDVRVIAATNRDLKDSIREGHFRSDLFYRISAFQIELPSLRNRKEEIEVLTWHFARTLAARLVKKVSHIRPAFLEALKQHSFPGNIRELKNLVERALILMDGDVLDVDHLPLEMQPLNRFGIPTEGEQTSETSLAFAEKEHIRKILIQTKGNKTETARLLHIALTTLYRKLEEYKL